MSGRSRVVAEGSAESRWLQGECLEGTTPRAASLSLVTVRHGPPAQGCEVWRAPGYYDFHKFTNTFAAATSTELGGHRQFKGTSWAKDDTAQHLSWDSMSRPIDVKKKTCAPPHPHRIRRLPIPDASSIRAACSRAASPAPLRASLTSALGSAQVRGRSRQAEHRLARDGTPARQLRGLGIRVVTAAAARPQGRAPQMSPARLAAVSFACVHACILRALP